MSSDTPRTAAGRALLAREAYNSRSFALITAEAIRAIEDEAREQALAEAEAAFRRIGTIGDKDDPEELVAFPAVLAALASLRKPVQPTVDYLADKDRSADEHRDPSDCPQCGEWRDSPSADCAACGYRDEPVQPKGQE